MEATTIGKTNAWTTLESDPGLFTSLVGELGVEGCQVEEVYALDDDLFSALSPAYGLIFLFRWHDDLYADDHAADPSSPSTDAHDAPPEGLFFANQIIDNACATLALLNILLQPNRQPPIAIGPSLAEFKDFTIDFPPPAKGLAMTNCPWLRQAHQKFARPFLLPPDLDVSTELKELKREKDGKRPRKKVKRKVEYVDAEDAEDIYHFISYVPFEGNVYELDGLRKQPKKIGSYDIADPHSWWKAAKPAIIERIEMYSANEIRFNLMALIRDRTLVLNEQLQELEQSSEPDENEIKRIKQLVADEKEKRDRYHEENVRRQHNYHPLLHKYMQVLAEKGVLQKLLSKR